MDGNRVRKYWSNEIQAMLDTYRQFQILVHAQERENGTIPDGADHNGEDGRYVENLICEYLKRYLPKDLEVLTGFILRPAVKTCGKDKGRKDKKDCHSTQLDIIVFNSSKYPIFQRFGSNAIVPPEGVVGIISVKKKLHDKNIKHELKVLKQASKLCKSTHVNKSKIRGPFIALISMSSDINKVEPSTENWIFNQMKEVYSAKEDYFDNLIGYIGVFDSWSIFKKRPDDSALRGNYLYFKHRNEEQHLGFQFLLTGLLSVYYDPTRNLISRPGFTGFESNRDADSILGYIDVKGLR